MTPKYQQTVKNAFNGKVNANVDKGGYVSFSIAEGAKLDKYEQKAFDHLSRVVESDETVTQKLLDHQDRRSKKVDVGSYRFGELDLEDLSSLGNDKKRVTTLGAFVHESVEQLSKQERKAEGHDVTGNNDFLYNHDVATNAENETDEYQRQYVGMDGYLEDDNGNQIWFQAQTIKDKKGNIVGVRYTRYEDE